MTDKPAHTPGPWELMHAEHGSHIEVVTNRGHIGLAFAGRFTDGSTGEANARLIAAAPDLLRELRRMMNMFAIYANKQPLGLEASACRTAQAAIAKATSGEVTK